MTFWVKFKEAFLSKGKGHKPALTTQQQPSKQVVVPRRGVAVPAVVAELVLAFGNPVLGPRADGLHHFGVLAAQLALLVHQTGDVVAHHLGAQGAHVPAGGGSGGAQEDQQTQKTSEIR